MDDIIVASLPDCYSKLVCNTCFKNAYTIFHLFLFRNCCCSTLYVAWITHKKQLKLETWPYRLVCFPGCFWDCSHQFWPYLVMLCYFHACFKHYGHIFKPIIWLWNHFTDVYLMFLLSCHSSEGAKGYSADVKFVSDASHVAPTALSHCAIHLETNTFILVIVLVITFLSLYFVATTCWDRVA